MNLGSILCSIAELLLRSQLKILLGLSDVISVSVLKGILEKSAKLDEDVL